MFLSERNFEGLDTNLWKGKIERGVCFLSLARFIDTRASSTPYTLRHYGSYANDIVQKALLTCIWL